MTTDGVREACARRAVNSTREIVSLQLSLSLSANYFFGKKLYFIPLFPLLSLGIRRLAYLFMFLFLFGKNSSISPNFPINLKTCTRM